MRTPGLEYDIHWYSLAHYLLSVLLCCVKVTFRPWKKKTLFYGHDRPNFPNWEIFLFFFFFLSLLKSCEISHFGQILRKFGWKFLESNWKYFCKYFLQKTLDFFFWIFLCFFFSRGAIFITRKKKIFKKKSRLTNHIWKVHPPEKQGDFFVVL